MANDDDRQRRGRWPGFDLGGGGKEPQPGQRSPWRFSLIYIVGALLVVLLLQSLFLQHGPTDTYTTFQQDLAQNDISGTVKISDATIGWTTKNGAAHSATVPNSFESTALF